jgi:hypothetical protein
MSIGSRQKSPLGDTAVQGRIARLVVLLLFVASFSAAAGFMQGEQVTVQSFTNVAAVDDGVRLIEMKNTFENPGDLTSSSQFITDPKVQSALGVGSGETCITGEEEVCRNKCSTTYVKIVSGSKQTKDCDRGKAKDNPIYEAIDALYQCIQDETGGAISIKDLDATMCRVDDPNKEIQQGDVEAEKALREEIIDEGNPEEMTKKTIQEHLAKAVRQTASEKGLLYVPVKCLDELKAAEQAKKVGIEKGKTIGSVDGNSADSCSYAGVTNCLLNPLTKKFDCTTKEGPSSQPGTGQQCTTGNWLEKTTCYVSKTVNQAKEEILRALGGSPLGGANRAQLEALCRQCSGGGSCSAQAQQACMQLSGQPQQPLQQQPQQQKPGGGGSENEGQNKCPSGQKYVTTDGKGRCVDDESSSDANAPSCILLANKNTIQLGESVTLRWRTANAEKIDITGVGENVPHNQDKIVKPQETTIYKLIARGKDSNRTKECTTTITVENRSDGETGSQPPQLSCTPGTIPRGGNATVKWACVASADSSSGENVATGGKLASEVEVSPQNNTQYSVSCMQDGKEIGKSSCSVLVGEPIFDILVSPTTAKRGDRVRVSWASLFMKSCRVTGPRGFDYTRQQGVIITEPFSLDSTQVPNQNIRAAIYNIECDSIFGKTFSRDVTVRLVE